MCRALGDHPLQRIALAARLPEHPGADLHDETRLFRQRDEVERHHQAPRGVVPAHERFEPRDVTRRQSDHRLEVQDELLVLDRPLEVGLQLEAAERGVMHLRLEHLESVLPRLLRDVHRDVGVAEQLLRTLRPGRPAHPDVAIPMLARTKTSPSSRNGPSSACRIRPATPAAPTLSPPSSIRSRTRPRPDGPRCRASADRSAALAHLAEQAVAGGVSERVVDRLEVVEVHEQHRDGVGFTRQPLQRVLDPVPEQRTVGEPVIESWKA